MSARIPTRAALAAALFAVTLVAFWPSLGNGFVAFDDGNYVTRNPYVQGGLTLQSLRWALTTVRGANWHPLTWISHMLDWQLYGPEPRGHHLTSLLLHVSNVLLLFFLFVRMTGAVGKSATVAALFAVHPLHVESVAWVAERKDVLSTLLWLLTTFAYVGYVRSPSRWRHALVAGTFALGLTAKPMLVTLPLTLFLLDFWPLGRWTGARGAWPLVREKAPLLALSLLSCTATLYAQRRGGAILSLEARSLVNRVGNAIVSYVAYLAKTVWPSGLAPYYPLPGGALPWWKVGGATLLLAGATGLALRARNRRPYVTAGWLWYLGTLVPVIGIVQVGGQAMADRYAYVPLIGIFWIVAWGACDDAGALATGGRRHTAAGTGAREPAWLAVPAGILVAVLAACTRVQTGYWRDSLSLFSHTLAVTGKNSLAHWSLASTLAEEGRLPEAIEHYEEAIRISPKSPELHNSLGAALGKTGRLEEAIEQFRAALQLRPDYAKAHGNLALILANQGRLDEAREHWLQAIRLHPEAESYLQLGVVLTKQGRPEKAIELYRRALVLAPDDPQILNNLGSTLARQGSVDEAIRHLQRAVELRPEYAVAHGNLAVALRLQGRYGDAWREVRLAQHYGYEPSVQFLRDLSLQMADPGPR